VLQCGVPQSPTLRSQQMCLCKLCCSVLQRVAVCSVLQCVAVWCAAIFDTQIPTNVSLQTVLQTISACCSVLQCVAVCCSILQCVAVYCSVLHLDVRHSVTNKYLLMSHTQSPSNFMSYTQLPHTTTHFNTRPHIFFQTSYTQSPRTISLLSVLQCTFCVAACSCNLQYFAIWCSVLQCVAVWCSVVQCVAVCCSVLQYVAVCCSM